MGVLETQDVQVGLKQLNKRRKHVRLLFLMSSALLVAISVMGFMLPNFVYGFYGFTPNVQHLHVPVALNQIWMGVEQDHDYFMQLLSWFLWFVVKVIVAFSGAFIVVALLRKIRFFYIRFQSFVLKFVGWLIAFILLWAGLTYLQYDMPDNEADYYAVVIDYDQQIQKSVLYQELNNNPTSQTVQAYMLAQAALLHQPVDLATAKSYMEQLGQAEKNDPEFSRYGFKLEQLWGMQQQVYGKSTTPLTQQLEPEILKIKHNYQFIKWLMIGLIVFFALFSLITGLLAQYFLQRIQQIQKRIQN